MWPNGLTNTAPLSLLWPLSRLASENSKGATGETGHAMTFDEIVIVRYLALQGWMLKMIVGHTGLPYKEVAKETADIRRARHAITMQQNPGSPSDGPARPANRLAAAWRLSAGSPYRRPSRCRLHYRAADEGSKQSMG